MNGCDRGTALLSSFKKNVTGRAVPLSHSAVCGLAAAAAEEISPRASLGRDDNVGRYGEVRRGCDCRNSEE